MKLYFEDAEHDYLYPRDHFYPKNTGNRYVGTIEATVTDIRSGKSFSVIADETYSEDEFENLRDFRDHLESHADDLIMDEMDKDSRFDEYPDYSEFEFEIDEIYADFGNFREAVQPKKRRLKEANENMVEQVEQLIDSIIEKNLETNLAQVVERQVQGYDRNWADTNFDAEYKTIKQNFVAEVARSLFAKFNG